MMVDDEERTVARWLDFVDAVVTDVLPPIGGRMVKSLGDGMLLDFGDIQSAATAAFALQALSRKRNEGLPPSEQIRLRMAIEVGNVFVDQQDVYGQSVNLASRLMTTLAGPDEIVISANARDQLTPILDAEVDDLGECYLKGIKSAVRAYRIGPPGPHPVIAVNPSGGPLLPSIAIIPFTARMSPLEHDVLGEVLADEVIRALSRSQNIDVISRLSTTAFRGRLASIAEIGGYLKVTYVLSGTYRTDSETIILDLELSEVRSEHIVWSERFQDKIAGIFQNEQELISRVVADVHNAVAAQELARARTNPFVTLESYTLLLSAITLMHRRSKQDFMSAREMLQAVIDRNSRQPLPQAWLANWHVLHIQQGMSDDVPRDTAEAVRCINTALDSDPDSSLALAIDGLVHTHMTKRHDVAEARYIRATQCNPNDALAWLLKGTHHAFTGRGEQAVKDTQRALKLSPLDPQGYYYHSLCASAYLAAGNNERALTHAELSLRSNKLHTSTLRARAFAQWRLGLHDAARETGAELMRLEPNLTVSSWLSRSPTSQYEFGRELGRLLSAIGIPN